ncbi:MAG: DUF6157 family protein [Ornithinimicrobium sp.]|uniref:DUF6157 family protein n=1 Tax=Ornithinimicrobium sp. TaxID=1977084 RepID=UPI0026DEC5F4|nr:DUF6157 family protein [Ornithinimicrobium sp.]MDO5739047.1 DUF6157 family protein [Ornithinimicrobium sp.]
MHSTNYVNTLITVAPDTKAVEATQPPAGKGSVAELQFEMMHGHDYEFTSDDVIFSVFADRRSIAADDRKPAREEFFSKGQACLRTSPLAKTYGWGIHADAHSRVALVPMGTDRYDSLMNDDTTVKRAAMKSSR